VELYSFRRRILKYERVSFQRIIPDIYPPERYLAPVRDGRPGGAQSELVGNFVSSFSKQREANPLMTLLRIKRGAFDVP